MFDGSSFLPNPISFLIRMSHSSTLDSLNRFQTNSTLSGRALSDLVDLTGSYSSGYGDKCCPPVVDPYTWLALIAGIALATFFLQMAIVNNIPVGGRKKRSYKEGGEEEDMQNMILRSLDQYTSGNSTWLDIFRENMMLNEANWLWIDTSNEDVKDDINDEDPKEDDAVCRTEAWRCLSSVVETGLHCFGKDEELVKFGERVLYKIAFHKTANSIWDSFLTIPEARNAARCLSQHGACVTREAIVRRRE